MDSMKNLECFYNESTTGHQKQTSSFSTLNNLSLKENTNNSKLDMKLDRSFNSKEDRASTKSLIKSKYSDSYL